MPKIADNERYLNTGEAIQALGASRQHFYNNAKPQLAPRYFGAKKAPWYKESDIIALRDVKPFRKADISITGMFSDWTKHLDSLGYNAETKDDVREIAHLPEDAVQIFHLTDEATYYKRERMSYASGIPICVWSTYYPAYLLEDIIPQLVAGNSINIIEYLKDHGHTIAIADERYSARITTFEEQTRFALRNEQAVLTLQRACYTRDEKEVVLYSDMVLLGNWFDARRKYTVDHWL